MTLKHTFIALGLVTFAAPAIAGHHAEGDMKKEPVLDHNIFEGTFAGTYMCSLGEQGLVVEIAEVKDEADEEGWHEAYGRLQFFSTMSNPDRPEGAFYMNGRVNPVLLEENIQMAKIEMLPGDWIVEPDNYGSAGITGTIVNGSMQGKVEGGTSCVGLSASKVAW